MSVTIAGIRFDHHDYDERGDVLYLSVEGYDGPPATVYASPEGHNVESDDAGRVIAMTLVNVRSNATASLRLPGPPGGSKRTSCQRRSPNEDTGGPDGGPARFPPSVSLHLFRSMGFGPERNRPPPRPRVFPWLPAWAFEEGGSAALRRTPLPRRAR